jgi:uncharacterized protein YgiM (DUF1202 family)
MKKKNTPGNSRWTVTYILTIGIFLFLLSCDRNREVSKDAATEKAGPSLYETVYPKYTVNIRSGPGTTYSVVRKAKKGEELLYTILKNDWYKLKVENGKPDEWIYRDVVLTYVDKLLRADSQLALLKWSWSVQSGDAIAEGIVENVSDKDLQNVKAIIVYKSKKDTFIASGSTEVKPNPIRSGKTGSFKIKTKYKRTMDHAEIDFFYPSDKPIEWYESDD